VARRILLLAVCVVVLLPACRKKTRPQEPTVAKQPSVQAPAGMAVIKGVGKGPVFIRKAAVTIGEYCDFVRAVGRPVPLKWSGEGVELADPVTALTLKEAQDYATWQLARLPDAREWRAAAAVVGDEPYPWSEDIGPDIPRTGARLYLVQDYLPGSDGERAAIERKDQLLQQILSAHADRIVELQDELKRRLTESESEWQDLWRKYKLEFFSYLKEKKNAVQLQAERRRRKDVLDILDEVVKEKMKQIHLKASQAGQAALDKAAEEYQAFLNRNRKEVKDKAQKLEESAKALGEESLRLKKKLEELGESVPAATFQQARQKLEGASRTVATLNEALNARNLLEQGLGIVAGFGSALDEIRQSEARVKQEAQKLQSTLKELAKPDEGKEKIRSLQEKIVGFNKHLEREFLQEKLLFDELGELLASSARVEALKGEIEELDSALGGLPRPEQTEEAGGEAQ